MKIFKIVIFVFCLLVPMNALAAETETQDEIQDKLFAEFDFSEIDQMMEEIFPEKLTFYDTVLGLINGDVDFSLSLVKQLIMDQFTYELSSSRSSIIHILVLVIIAAIFANFSGMFQSTQVSEISFFMLYMLMITICLNNFRILVESTSANLGQLMEFMKLLGPVYFLAVAFATGSVTSIAFYQLVLLLIFLIEIVIQSFLIPMVQIYLIMRILGGLSQEIHLSKFAELIETIVSWSLKTLLASVVGLNMIQRLITPAIDSVKRSFVTKGSEAIPVVGDAIGGVADIIFNTAVLIKNGIGVTGMIVCLVLCLVPVIQMAITVLMYQLVAALMQPISDKRMIGCISSMADGTKMMLRIVCTTGVLFLISIAIVASTTGG